MYRVFRSGNYKKKLNKLDSSDYDRVISFEQALKQEPYSGKPLGYKFFREKKFNGKRLIFLVYEQHKCLFLITITGKKLQQHEIDMIKTNLDVYRDELDRIMGNL
jgi:mRNA-degrading endonuclease RelE of RelBE toxin-antitoxin system